MPKAIWRALRVYCALEDHDVGGILGLALRDYLRQHGGPQVRELLKDA